MPHEIATQRRFLKEASDEELGQRLAELKEEHFRLRIQAAVTALDNPKRIGIVRTAVARVLQEQGRRRSQREGDGA